MVSSQTAPKALAAPARGGEFVSAEAGLNWGDLPVFRDIVESSPAPILVVATAGSQPVQYANAAFQRVTGYSKYASVGRNWMEFFPDEFGGAALSAARQAITDGREARVVLWVRRNDGSRLYLKLKLSPLGARGGYCPRFMIVLHDMTAERRAHDTLEQQAHFDALTGLANRHLLYARFEEMLVQARSFTQSFSVVLLDMNDFKTVNDRFGHEIGDELLKCVAERLRGSVQAHDTVSRLGGDEFALLLPDTDDGGCKVSTIARIVESVQQPATLNGCSLMPSCSIGVSHYPNDGNDRQSLLRAADRDLYRAKATRPGGQERSRSAQQPDRQYS